VNDSINPEDHELIEPTRESQQGGGLAGHALSTGACGGRGTSRHAMTVHVFMLYGVPCGQCRLPAHSIEVYPNGVRTSHNDWRKRPCDSLRNRTQASGQARLRVADPQGDSAPVRTLVSVDRKVS
jgi:hypothetical protein